MYFKPLNLLFRPKILLSGAYSRHIPGSFFPFYYVTDTEPYRCIFFRLCTEQNSSHWQFTLSLPLRLNRSSLSICRMLAKTGSTVPMRFEYINLPEGESILCFILSAGVTGISLRSWKKATCPIWVRSGWRRHWALRWQGTQADFGPLNRVT